MSKYTPAKKASNKKWDKENMEYLSIMLPKGYRERLKAVAAEKGTSVNGMLRTLLEDTYNLT